MHQLKNIDVLFIAGFGPITQNNLASKTFYLDVLNLPLKAMPQNETYLSIEHGDLEGVKHFAVWPLSQAAQSCFGSDQWPTDVVTPQSWMEFEVQNLLTATEQLLAQSYTLLVNHRVEPWGQSVTRLLSPEGMLVGLTLTPWLRDTAD